MVDEQREARARELRLDGGDISAAYPVLRGIAALPSGGWAQGLLKEAEAAIKDNRGKQADLLLEGKEAR